MDTKLIASTAVGSAIGTVTVGLAFTALTAVSKKIERSRRAKREQAHKEPTKK